MTWNEDVRICIISHSRSDNVERYNKWLAKYTDEIYWYVGKGETHDYISNGAIHVIESGGLIESRNKALDDAFQEGKVCCQISDDLMGLMVCLDNNITVATTLKSVIQALYLYSRDKSYKLIGLPPTDNDFFYSPQQSISFDKFIVADLILVKPTYLRFDSEIYVKEDYDFTLQHIREYGGILRINNILATFAHRKNKGGTFETRTLDREMEVIRRLKAKWGDIVKSHETRTRTDEILINPSKLIQEFKAKQQNEALTKWI
mgnify:CR=1 FL=1